MKQILSLALAMLPCLAWAQYPSNGNQKITLGEQTSADGLIYRGVLADTGIITPSSDTSAYIILDTVNHRFYNYNRATNVWSVAGGGTSVTTFSGGTTGLTPSTATSGAVTLSGTLAVANGGTNQTSFTAGNILFGNGTTNINSSNNLFWDNTNGYIGINTNTPTSMITIKNTGNRSFDNYSPLSSNGNGANIIWSSNTTGSTKADIAYLGVAQDGDAQRSGRFYFQLSNSGAPGVVMTINKSGNLGLGAGVIDAVQKLEVVGNAKFTAVGAGTFSNNLNITSDGTLTTATSDEKFKYNIRPLNYGLSTLLQLKPVNFQWIEGEEEDLGFIAQDVAEIIPEAVNTNWNSDLLFRYESLIPILTKAIQEQNLLIKALEQRIINLENK